MIQGQGDDVWFSLSVALLKLHILIYEPVLDGLLMEVRGQATQAGSLLLPGGFLGLNHGHQAWQEVPLPAGPPSLPFHFH